MTVRRFDGVDDFITLAPGGTASIDGGPITVAVIWRARSVHAGTLIQAVDGVNTLAWNVNPFNDGFVYFSTSEGFVGGTPYVTDTWYLTAFTKATGLAEVRRHHGATGTTIAHAATGTSLADTLNIPFERIEIGRNRFGNEFLDGDVAIAGVWNTVLTDAGIDMLAQSSRWWVASTPAALWTFDQSDVSQPVQDVIGAGDQTAVTGTTVVQGQDPPGFFFQGAGQANAVSHNEESLRRVAKTRYNRDLQGALRRAMVTGAVTAAIGKDINGMCKAAYGAERYTNAGHGGMAFTLASAPAP